MVQPFIYNFIWQRKYVLVPNRYTLDHHSYGRSSYALYPSRTAEVRTSFSIGLQEKHGFLSISISWCSYSSSTSRKSSSSTKCPALGMDNGLEHLDNVRRKQVMPPKLIAVLPDGPDGTWVSTYTANNTRSDLSRGSQSDCEHYNRSVATAGLGLFYGAFLD